jgi:ABC-type glycerol-3-phosphate transport system permease component
MAPVIILGILAQRHIVKGLTVGAVKGGGRT